MEIAGDFVGLVRHQRFRQLKFAEQFTLWSGDQRIGMTSIHLLFAIGFLVLLAVRMPTHAE